MLDDEKNVHHWLTEYSVDFLLYQFQFQHLFEHMDLLDMYYLLLKVSHHSIKMNEQIENEDLIDNHYPKKR